TPAFERRPGLAVHRVGRALSGAAASVQYSSVGAFTVARLRPDVIHAHDLLSPSTAALLASRGGATPVVAKVLSAGLGGDIDRLLRKPLGRRRLDAMARRFSAFIALSDEVAAELRDHGVPEARVRRIPNGVDTRVFRPATPDERARERAALGVGEGDLVALYCGRFYETKHVDVLIAAAHEAPVHLFAFGEGPVRDQLRRLASDPALGGRVQIRDPVSDTARLHRAADLYLSASEAEGMSGSVLEAMAAGTVVVAAPAPGMAELLEGGAGVITADRTPAAFARAIEGLSPAGRERMAATARERAQARYSIEAVADRLAELYRELAPEVAARAA
ncbi:MAG: D-inositol-3-phosphate glycosyltransferase, partial [Thermoleophilaceae bacterium]|nr:D-inositol-3-phosphate glycosyltransferase [Thermoleophilaceae bacterium]